MLTNKLYILLLIIANALFVQTAFAQPSVQQIEQDILAHLQHIQYWRYEYSADDTTFANPISQDDSIANANKQLLEYLLAKGTQAEMLKTNFKLLENTELKITTSDDKKLRIYSWDVQAGTPQHYYNAVAQFETVRGTRTRVINEVPKNITETINPGGTFVSISSIAGTSNKKYYFPVYTAINSDKDVAKGISAYSISDEVLAEESIFKKDEKTVSNIEYYYDYAANYDFKKMKERYTLRIEKQALYVPVIEGVNITGKWQVYTWDSEKFVFDKNAK